MAYTPKKVVLLDVDGVVFKHTRALSAVSHRCNQYVSQKLGVEISTASKINSVLYKRFGHTVLGLERIYDYDIIETLPEFTKFVYSPTLIEYVHKYSADLATMHVMRSELIQLLRHCDKKDIDVYLFSNAPLQWCEMVLSMLNLKNADIGVFGSGHEIYDGLLKPHTVLYDNIYKFLSNIYKDPYLQLIYTDDSLQNIIPVLEKPNWVPVYMNESLYFGSRKMSTIKNLYELVPLL